MNKILYRLRNVLFLSLVILSGEVICCSPAISGGGPSGYPTASSGGIPAAKAAAIDKKMDDGNPTTGTVQALYWNYPTSTPITNSAVSDSSSTCYNTTSNTYSTSSAGNYGQAPNCGLNFKLQVK